MQAAARGECQQVHASRLVPAGSCQQVAPAAVGAVGWLPALWLSPANLSGTTQLAAFRVQPMLHRLRGYLPAWLLAHLDVWCLGRASASLSQQQTDFSPSGESRYPFCMLFSLCRRRTASSASSPLFVSLLLSPLEELQLKLRRLRTCVVLAAGRSCLHEAGGTAPRQGW